MGDRWKLNPSKSGEWYVLVGPYDPAFIDDLKSTVPVECREWRPRSKVWRIDPLYRTEVSCLISRHSGVVS